MERLGTKGKPKLITEDALKHKWREVTEDSEIHLYELRVRLPFVVLCSLRRSAA